MMANSESFQQRGNARAKQYDRLRRYVPLVLWMALIFVASTAEFSAGNTSRLIRPLLVWLFPGISEEGLRFGHFVVRKMGHFTEYAIFALLAARAFAHAAHDFLHRRWFLNAFLLIALYSLSDEFHQSFVPTRTGSVYDSLIDMSGGLTALALYALWRGRQSRSRART